MPNFRNLSHIPPAIGLAEFCERLVPDLTIHPWQRRLLRELEHAQLNGIKLQTTYRRSPSKFISDSQLTRLLPPSILQYGAP